MNSAENTKSPSQSVEKSSKKPIIGGNLKRFKILSKLGARGIMSAVILFLLVVGGVAAFFLSETNLDLRQQAAETVYQDCGFAKHGQAVCGSYAADSCVKCVNGQKVAANATTDCKDLPCDPNSAFNDVKCGSSPVGAYECAGSTVGSGCKVCVKYFPPGQGAQGRWEDADATKCFPKVCGVQPSPTKVPTPTKAVSPTKAPTSVPTIKITVKPSPTNILPSPTRVGAKGNGERCSSDYECSSNICATSQYGAFCVASTSMTPGTKANGERCNGSGECQSLNCINTAYGKYCVAAGLGGTCVQGTKGCDGNLVTTCNQGVMVRTESCGGACVAGACQSNFCTPFTKRCQGTSGYETCNAAGTAYVGQSCPTGQKCSGAGICAAPTPTKVPTVTKAPTSTLFATPTTIRLANLSSCTETCRTLVNCVCPMGCFSTTAGPGKTCGGLKPATSPSPTLLPYGTVTCNTSTYDGDCDGKVLTSCVNGVVKEKTCDYACEDNFWFSKATCLTQAQTLEKNKLSNCIANCSQDSVCGCPTGCNNVSAAPGSSCGGNKTSIGPAATSTPKPTATSTPKPLPTAPPGVRACVSSNWWDQDGECRGNVLETCGSDNIIHAQTCQYGCTDNLLIKAQCVLKSSWENDTRLPNCNVMCGKQYGCDCPDGYNCAKDFAANGSTCGGSVSPTKAPTKVPPTPVPTTVGTGVECDKFTFDSFCGSDGVSVTTCATNGRELKSFCSLGCFDPAFGEARCQTPEDALITNRLTSCTDTCTGVGGCDCPDVCAKTTAGKGLNCGGLANAAAGGATQVPTKIPSPSPTLLPYGTVTCNTSTYDGDCDGKVLTSCVNGVVKEKTCDYACEDNFWFSKATCLTQAQTLEKNKLSNCIANCSQDSVCGCPTGCNNVSAAPGSSCGGNKTSIGPAATSTPKPTATSTPKPTPTKVPWINRTSCNGFTEFGGHCATSDIQAYCYLNGNLVFSSCPGAQTCRDGECQ